MNGVLFPQTGIPYFAGTTNPACLAKAQANGPLAVASLTNLGCYANGSSILIPPAYGSYGTAGQNIFRGMPFYNLDLSITKQFKLQGTPHRAVPRRGLQHL